MFSVQKPYPVGDCNNIPKNLRELYRCPTFKVQPPKGHKSLDYSKPHGLTLDTEEFTYRRSPCHPITVLLDLDETLVHTRSNENEPEIIFDPTNPDHYQISLGRGEMATGVKRPHLDEFLDHVFKIAYPVIVWTAAQSLYARDICDLVFKKHWPTKVYTYDDCEIDEESDLVKKPLKKVYEDFPHVVQRERLIAVDDRFSAYNSKDTRNLMEIRKWKAIGEDNCLLQAKNYITDLKKKSGDVRSVIKNEDWAEFWE